MQLIFIVYYFIIQLLTFAYYGISLIGCFANSRQDDIDP